MIWAGLWGPPGTSEQIPFQICGIIHMTWHSMWEKVCESLKLHDSIYKSYKKHCEGTDRSIAKACCL